jgi:flagellar basal-body rod protein FlgB
MTAIFGSITPLELALDYHVERHNLIASNISNADTPGYRPREVAFEMELGETQRTISLSQSREGHMQPAESESGLGLRVYEETWATPGADGNYVRLEHEMSRLQANAVEYQAVTQMISHHLGLLRYSISGRR